MKRNGPPRVPVAERFWDKLDMSGGPAACWIWTRHRHKFGYGEVGGRDAEGRAIKVSAHRVAWKLTHGPIPEGLWVLHRCDNPPCCNPAHLFLGTVADNTQDMISKGRMARGSRRGHAKLDDEKVREIRRSSDTERELAARFGVCQQAINQVRRRETWKHVT